MGFSLEWNDIYGAQKNIIKWPWSDVVSLSYRYCNHLFEKGASVLELGCGTGANIQFFKSNDFKYFGIDGNAEVIASLQSEYPEYKENIICGDFTKNLGFDGYKFDLILDRAAITHNDTKAIIKTFDNIKSSLKVNGIFLAIDWFSTKHMDSKSGKIVDNFTRTMIPEGQFEGVGNVHFSDFEHLNDIFSDFKVLSMKEKVISEFFLKKKDVFSAWDIVAQKN